MITDISKDEIDETLRIFNQYHEKIQFTMEHSVHRQKIKKSAQTVIQNVQEQVYIEFLVNICYKS